MIQIAILGFGTIGQGLAQVIEDNASTIKRQIGDLINVKYILDLREFPEHKLGDRVIHDITPILEDKEIKIVAEMMGGSHPAYDFSLAAIKAGKSVVTSNKEVVANFGPDLIAEAGKRGLRYLYEASVGGGIPVLRPMQTSLLGNEIVSIDGILNGTTNYILEQMTRNGLSMDVALKQAQELGFAERDPSADIDGLDAARKICILAAISYGLLAKPESVDLTGIRNVTLDDINGAISEGKVLKLIAHAELKDGKLALSVKPTKVPSDSPLASVNGVMNAILIKGKSLGDVMFYGAGAGSLPTASACLADVIDLIMFDSNQPKQFNWERV